MSIINTYVDLYEFQRKRTLGLLDKIEAAPAPAAALGWRPGPGRAHVAWQLMHVAITEELFSCERLATKAGRYHDLRVRFRGGSTPDESPPSAAQLREVLAGSRADLLATLGDCDLRRLDEVIWEPGDGRRLTLRMVLQIIAWHEAHHQGQAHLTWNLFTNRGDDS